VKIMMRRHVLLIAVVLGCLLPARAFADAIDSREISLIMESTVVDMDISMIALHHGNDFDATLHYVSRIESTGWQGRLWGTYGGRDVDNYYTGTVTYLGGADNRYDIDYTSEWLFDGESGTGSGTAIYTDPDFDFGIDLVNMEVSGSVSVSYGIATLTLSGSKSFSTHELTVSAEASAIDLPLVGSAASAEVSFTYNQLTGEYESSVTARVLGGWLYERTETINDGTIRRPDPPPPDPPPPPPPPPPYPYPDESGDPGFGNPDDPDYDPNAPGYNNMTVNTVPDPTTALFFALILPGVVGYRRWRRRKEAA